MKRELIVLAAFLSAVSLISVTGVQYANAHPGKPENRCRESSDVPFTVICKEEPVLGQEVKFTSAGGLVTHRPVIFVDTTFMQVAFDCGHFKDGTPVPACLNIIYQYEVKGN
jgi:hypothetical protein